MKISEWMQVMLDEIARKKAEQEQSRLQEAEPRAQDSRRLSSGDEKPPGGRRD